MTENISREIGHEECKVCIDTFVSKYPYGDRCLDFFAKEHVDAFVYMCMMILFW